MESRDSGSAADYDEEDESSVEENILEEQGAQVDGLGNDAATVLSSDEIKPVPEASVNVSATIMLKVPTYNLAPLRECFEAEPDGLNLYQFLKAFVANMDLESDQDLISVVPDLIDFFDLVDIDGDGSMQWSEFVMFVIELVVKEEVVTIFEELELVNRHTIQPPGSQSVVNCCKYIPELNKICLGVGSDLQIYDTVENSPTWLSEGVKFKLKKKPAVNVYNPNPNASSNKQPNNSKTDVPIEISDLLYIDSKDIMAVLRTDLCIEFLKFTSRTKASADLILSFGFHVLPRPYNRLACRDKPKETLCLFGVSSHQDVDCWEVKVGKVGPVKLENHILLQQHTDFVRDIVIIRNDSYSLFATGALDKTVNVWDLDTLKHRVTRTGFSAGVQCVAFDGKSILLAGSFDYQIIGWDLDAHINKPIFSLWGHNNSIIKIVAFGVHNRCFTLDASGVFKMWDTSKTSATDKEGRLIDTINYVKDHAYSFEIIPKNVSQFPTLNGLIIAMQGRHQHVYKVKDTSTKLSPPLAVLFSLVLQMVITVHLKDVVFWSAITGEERNRMANFTSSEALVATLDDRKRKLIVGSSNGVITVFNCLKAAKIKSFPPLQSAVRFLIYTPDKTIICVAGVGDLHIFDDLVPEDKLADSLIRECRGHESDVISLAYSHPLALIATADCVGNVIVWDYQYLTAEIILSDLIAADVGHVVFMDPYPFLLLCDNYNCFTVIPVGPAASSFGRKHWKVTSTVHRPIRRPPTIDEIAIALKEDQAVASHQSAELEEGSLSQSISQRSDHDEASDEVAQHVMSLKRVKTFLKERNEVKCIAVDHNYDFASSDGLEMSADLLITTQNLEVGAEKQVERVDGERAERPVIPRDLKYIVFTGHEDGTIAAFDLVPVLKSINYPALKLHETAPKLKGYDPRKLCVFRVLRSADYLRAAYTESDVTDGEILVSCPVIRVWHGHKGVFSSMQLVGDDLDLLTAGEDSCVHLFSQKGVLKGVLTRGQDVDMVFKPRWTNPIDMLAREAQRSKEAKRLIKLLNLKRATNFDRELIDPFSDDIVAIRRALRSRAAAAAGSSDDRRNLSVSSKKDNSIGSPDRFAMTKYDPTELPRVLLIGQLRGEVTYELSSKDYAKLTMAQKENEARHKRLTAKQHDILTDKTPGTTYLNELLRGGGGDGGEGGKPLHAKASGGDGKVKSSSYLKRNFQPFAHREGERKIKTKYELEMEQIEMSDPANWEITSHNRQRALYENMYTEMTKSKLTKDPMKIIAAKLDALAPDGDFEAFAKKIRSHRAAAKKAIVDSLLTSTSSKRDIIDAGTNGSTVPRAAAETERSGASDEIRFSPFRAIEKPFEKSIQIDPLRLSDLNSAPSSIRPIPIQSTLTPGRIRPHSPAVTLHPGTNSASKGKNIFKVSRFSPPRMEPLEDLRSPNSPQPLPGAKSPQFSCKADMKKYMSEKEKNLELLRSFDSQVSVVEKVYRRAKKQTKKNVKKVKQDPTLAIPQTRRSFSPTSSLSLLPPPGQLAASGRLDALPRHTSAQILIKKQSSVDGLIEIGARKLKVEESIHRKMNVALSYSHDHKKKDSSFVPLSFTALPDNYQALNFQKLRTPKTTHDGDIFAAALSYTVPSISGTEIKAISPKNGPPKVIEKPTTISTAILQKLEEKADEDSIEAVEDEDYEETDEFEAKDAVSGNEVAESAKNLASEHSISENMDDLFESYEPNLNDHSALKLNQLLHHKLVKDRKEFYDTIMRLLDYKSKEESISVEQISASLSEVVHHLSPFLTDQEKQSCAQYLKKNLIREEFLDFQANEDRRKITEQERRVLHSLFSFFDKDKSGTVNLNEIMEVVKQTNLNSKNKSDFDLLAIVPSAIKSRSSKRSSRGRSFNNGRDNKGSLTSAAPNASSPAAMSDKVGNLIDEGMVRHMIDSIDRDFNDELDFEEFFVLFSSTMR